jgi:hypothetical protein
MMMLILDSKMMMLTNHAMRSLSCATLVVAGPILQFHIYLQAFYLLRMVLLALKIDLLMAQQSVRRNRNKRPSEILVRSIDYQE